jgi:hypothetical protein
LSLTAAECFDRPAVHLDDVPNNGETETARLARGARFRLTKAFEHIGKKYRTARNSFFIRFAACASSYKRAFSYATDAQAATPTASRSCCSVNTRLPRRRDDAGGRD